MMQKKAENYSKRKYILNPYLPEWEYIPDGEPHVFGNRVYLYGSHDRADGEKYCMNDYVCYSADIHNLKDWRYEGVIYRSRQDPRAKTEIHQMWAPDVARGKDGRYYLYYCLDDSVRSIGVAVSDTPAGKYEFYGLVQDRMGGLIGEREGDTIAFDPGILLDEDGSIYLYSGNGPRTEDAIGKELKASVVMLLEDDMKTIRTEPKKLLPILGEAQGSGFEGHEFFEASSIRKVGRKYYLVYSSVNLHELCYAVSDRPDCGFTYGGVVISNADIMERGTRKEDRIARNCIGNNHGGIERINGEYYIFYHRQTNRTMFSRQGCAEKIFIKPDGSIPQVRTSSCGLNDGPLPGIGVYPAACVCHLYGRYPQEQSRRQIMGEKHPYLTQDGPDFDAELLTEASLPPREYVANGKNGMHALFRYFDLKNTGSITVRTRGSSHGKLLILAEEDGRKAGEIIVEASKEWKNFSGEVSFEPGEQEICFVYQGTGVLELLEFILKE